MAEEEILRHDVDVITVRGTFKRAKSTFSYLVSKWIWFILFGILGGAVGLYVAYSTKPTYTGTLNFVLSTGSRTSNISGLASQLGFDMGASQTGDVFSGDNILALFKSKKMIKSALFKRPPESSDILANIIVKDLNWDKNWANKDRTKGLFPFPDNGILNPVQDSLMRELYSYIIKKQLSIARTDPKLSLYTLTTISTNEIFSCYLTRFLMDETASFYINTKTSSAKQALQLLEKESDSLRRLLGSSIVSTAAESDKTFALNPAMQVQKAPVQKGQIRTTVISTAYGEIVKNLELAKINLQKENPLYQIIDAPDIPLVKDKMSKLMALIVGGLAGAFLCLIILLSTKIYRSLNT